MRGGPARLRGPSGPLPSVGHLLCKLFLKVLHNSQDAMVQHEM